MRFIVMHKTDAKMEAGERPDQEIIKKMGQLVGAGLKDGTFLDGAGLHRSARRVRLRCKAGSCEAERGPYAGHNELVESMALVRTASIDAAVDHARQFGAALGDAAIEIGPVVEPWDLSGAPKPPGAPDGEQFLLLFKGDADDERRTARSAERAAAVARIDEELATRGIFVRRTRIAPSSTGKRLSGPQGKRTWTDGPFTESKELIAGFSILELPSLADAVAWAERYAAILVHNEVDVRALAD